MKEAGVGRGRGRQEKGKGMREAVVGEQVKARIAKCTWRSKRQEWEMGRLEETGI